MKTRLNEQESGEHRPELSSLAGAKSDIPDGEFQASLRAFKDSLDGAAEKPEAFWAHQRAAISERLRRSVPSSKLKPVLVWASASIIVLVCLITFSGKSKLPAPDFAVGADQNLLVDVERALYRDYPEALAPAAALVKEMR